MNARALEREMLRNAEWLDQPFLRWLQLGIIAVGCMFWVEARAVSEAFSADIYGTFAVAFPAEMWAAIMAGASAMIWLGLVNPVRRWMVAVGAIVQTLQYAALGYSAIWTGGEAVIGIHCTALFVPIFALTAWRAAYAADA